MSDLNLADVSDWNPGVNFADYLAGGRPGVFIKATEGLSFVASTFAPYRDQAHAAGLTLVGMYHFAKSSSPTLTNLVASLAPHETVSFHPHWTVNGKGRYRYQREPVQVTHEHLELASIPLWAFGANPVGGEAGHFLDTVAPLRPGEVAVLDAEVPGLSASWCRAWLQAVEQATGRTPLLYCSWSFWTDVLGSMTDYPLWIAAYHALGHDDPRDSVPGCRIWQYTDNAQIPGVGSGDDSVFRGTLHDLAAIGGATPPIPPKEPEVAKTTISFSVRAGEARKLPVPAIGEGFAWTKVSVTYASEGVEVVKANIGPNERPIPGLAPEGVETARGFAGRSYVDLQAGDEWVEVILDTSVGGTLDLVVEASDA